VKIVDPAHEVALKVKQYFSDHPKIDEDIASNSNYQLYFSDLTDKTKVITRKWLGRDLPIELQVLE
jgi:glutamate racemase